MGPEYLLALTIISYGEIRSMMLPARRSEMNVVSCSQSSGEIVSSVISSLGTKAPFLGIGCKADRFV
jgi:hypothetical protein